MDDDLDCSLAGRPNAELAAHVFFLVRDPQRLQVLELLLDPPWDLPCTPCTCPPLLAQDAKNGCEGILTE
jgi:hypothetical protein